jgi:hypothetical protein
VSIVAGESRVIAISPLRRYNTRRKTDLKIRDGVSRAKKATSKTRMPWTGSRTGLLRSLSSRSRLVGSNAPIDESLYAEVFGEGSVWKVR